MLVSRTAMIVSNLTGEVMRDPDTLDRLQASYGKFKSLRAEIIDASLDIENTLTVTILHLMVQRDYKLHRLLRLLVMDTEFCSFMQKRKLFSQLCDLFPALIELAMPAQEVKALRQEINKLILDRDKFAHGTIYVDASDETIFIKYASGGEKRETLTEESTKQFFERAERIADQLDVINEYFRENPDVVREHIEGLAM